VTRVLEWEGCLNVRDLGGVPLEDGGETAFGVVVRSDNIRRLRDLTVLERHGIVRIVDLRFDDEVAHDAHTDVPVEVINAPLMSFDPAYRAQLEQRAVELEPAEYLEWSYLEFLEQFRDNFGRAVRAIASADGAVCVHCMGGRDRTGLITALLLRLAGAAPDDVAEDYWLSEDALREPHEEWVALAENERDARIRSVFVVAPRQVIVGVLAAVEERYGSVRAYLEGAGVPAAELDTLAARLRGDG
jgi:protein tyrosine/serine phosphatase